MRFEVELCKDFFIMQAFIIYYTILTYLRQCFSVLPLQARRISVLAM